MANGVVYLQDEDANVYALALATGQLKWEYPVNDPETSGPGPDGVAVSGGAVYGTTSTSVFALNAATGRPASRYPSAGTTQVPSTRPPEGGTEVIEDLYEQP